MCNYFHRSSVFTGVIIDGSSDISAGVGGTGVIEYRVDKSLWAQHTGGRATYNRYDTQQVKRRGHTNRAIAMRLTVARAKFNKIYAFGLGRFDVRAHAMSRNAHVVLPCGVRPARLDGATSYPGRRWHARGPRAHLSLRRTCNNVHADGREMQKSSAL